MEQNNGKTPANPNPNSSQKPAGKGPKFNVSWIYGILMMILLGTYFFGDQGAVKTINSYPTFKSYVEKGYIESIEVYAAKNQVQAQVEDSLPSLKAVFGEHYKNFEKDRRISVNIPSAEKFEEFIAATGFSFFVYKFSES